MRNEWQRLNTAMRPVASICDSHRTALPDARSAASNGSPTNCSRSTAPPCATRTASAPSPRQLCCARSATQPGSTASPSSPAGAAPAPSRSHQAKAQQIRSSTGSTSEATGASTACFTSPRSAKPTTTPSSRLPRPQSQRRQNTTRSTTSPQTPPRQPSHPPNVARRNRPTTHSRTPRLTREPLTVGLSDPWLLPKPS